MAAAVEARPLSPWERDRVRAQPAQPRARPLTLGALACLLLCLVALALRLPGLGNLPLWVDEAYTFSNTHDPLSLLLGARLNAHPPGYFLMERYWLRLVGDSEYAMRLSSALLSVLAVVGLWRLVGRLGGRWSALVAAALVTVAPIAVGYGREARMYAIVVAEVALLLVLADRAAERGTPRRWLVFGALALATELTHYTGLAAVAAAALWTLPTTRRQVGWWVGVHAVVLGVFAAWGLHFLQNIDAWYPLVWLPWATRVSLSQQTIDWATDFAGPTLGQISFGDALAGPNLPKLLMTLPLFALAAAGLAGIAWRRRRAALAMAMLAVGPLVAIIVLEPIRPMWHIRFTIVGLAAVFALAALGVGFLGRRPALAGALVLLVLGPQLYGLATRPPDPREDWRAIARDLRPRLAPSDVVLGGVEAITRYYLGGAAIVSQRPVPIGRPPQLTIDELNQSVGNARVVWLVPAEDALVDPTDVVGGTLERYATARERLTAGGVPVSHLTLRPHEPFTLSPPMTPIAALYGGAIRLTGYSAERRDLGAEWSVQVYLDARIERPLDRDYKLFAHLLDAGGKTIAQRDLVPVDGARRPTSQMEVGQPVRFEVAIRGAADVIRAGRSVGVGFYDEKSGERLPLEPSAPENRLLVPVTGG
jgi:mannosyltransferase